MTGTARGILIGSLAGAAMVAAVVFRGCDSESGPILDGPVQVKPDTVVLQSRPKVVTRWRDRIIVRQVPVRVIVTEGVPDTAFAMRWARAALASDSARRAVARGDSLQRQPSPILPAVTGAYDGSTLELWLTRSDGSLMQAAAKLKPRWQFFTGTDAGSDTLPIFRSDRWFVRLARQSVHCAPPVGVMAGVGALAHREDRLLGALVAGGATLVGCLVS